ncbi:MAG: patatin-like phospholipase family protein [Burkholderiales bacterium]
MQTQQPLNGWQHANSVPRPRRYATAPGITALTWIFGAIAFTQVQAQAPTVTDVAPLARPKIGLVLSGGGARGLAHIGVLRVLREHRIPIDVIASTSMGAIIGGAYAAGMTPDEMQGTVLELNWDDVFAGRPPRVDLHWRRKEDDSKNLSKFEFGLGRDGLSLPSGAFGAHELEQFLRRLTASVHDVNDLRRLPIPFVAMATDLESGAEVELDDVPLSQAMRASMSIPGAFAPVESEGRLLVDGGLVANLPVQAARRLGADIVIAVNVGTPLSGRRELGTAFGVAQQMINILTERNVEAAKRELRATDVLVEPDFGKLTLVDFSKAAQIIALGERAAREALARLQPLAIEPQGYAAFEARRTARVSNEVKVRVARVEVEGLTRTNPDTVSARIDLRSDRYASAEEVRLAVRNVNAEAKFERVDYRFETVGADRVLVVRPIEKSWGPHTLRLGGLASSNFRDEHTFNLLAAHTLTDVNSWGAEWRNEVQLGNTTRLLTDLYQPLGAGSRWFALPRFEFNRASTDVFDGDNVIGRVQASETAASLQLGYTLPRWGYVSMGRTQGQLRADTLIAPAPQPVVRVSTNRWTARAVLNRLDSYTFPKHGFSLVGEISEFDRDDANGSASRQSATGLLSAWTLGRHTVLLNAYAVRATGAGGGARLGGFLNLSGTPLGRFSGARTAFGSLIGYREISDLIGEMPAPIYVGGSIETGNSTNEADSFTWHQMKRAGSVFVAADTLIGPVYLAYGRTAGGNSALYLFWGRF